MIFSYNWLQTFFTRKLPKPEKLAKLLTLHSFEVSEIKKVKSDHVLDIDVLPNRAGDCFSHIGIARETAAITGLTYRDPVSVKLHRDRVSVVSVEVKQPQACLRYTAKVITDVKVGASPKWLKDHLEVCGLNPINNIVDIANYVMLETGQPLHAFDSDKLAGGKIIVRLAKEGEKITTLDNQKFDLDAEILVIADAEKPVAIAGIKGGMGPEIDGSTKTIILESANFNQALIRKTSKAMNLKTDASVRFEHGIDPNLTEFAINRAAYLIQKVALGSAAKDLIDFYPQKAYPKKVKLDLNYAESLLGVKISEREIRAILRRLGFKITGVGHPLSVEVPTFRMDISIPEDIIEEVGRIYGYEKIFPVFPVASLIPPKKNYNIFWENVVKDILKEAGFTEVYNYSFQKDPSTGSGQGERDIEVENPTSQEYRYLRSSLIPGLLRNIEKNKAIFSQIKIFEIGKIFNGEIEKRMVSGVVMGEDFYQLKGAIDVLFDKLGLAKVWYDDYQATPEDSSKSLWKTKRSAEIKVGDVELGFLGELRAEPKMAAFDLDLGKLENLAAEDRAYKPISKYPATIRDLAILVPPATKVEEVLNVIEIAGGSLAVDVDLFDIYEGEGISDGQKNLAFHIIYQAQDRTLTSIEVYKIHQNIIKTLEENPAWQVRK